MTFKCIAFQIFSVKNPNRNYISSTPVICYMKKTAPPVLLLDCNEDFVFN